MATTAELGQKVKAKYPGAYDDLADDDLGRRVKAKYPGAYDDFTDAPPAPPSLGDQVATSLGSRLSQKTGEGMLPGFNRVTALGQAAIDPLLGRTDEWGPDFATRYAEHLKANQGQSAQTQREHPVLSTAATMAGAAPTAVAVSGPQAIGRGASIVQGLTQGAGFGGAYAAGDTRETTPGGVLGDFFKGAVGGGVMGAGFGAAMPGVPQTSAAANQTPKAGITDDLAGWLRRVAGNRNIKAAGGIQSDITRARKQLGPGGANDGRAALQEIGAEMGEKGLVSPLSTPTKTFDRAAALMDDAGQRMGEVLQGADQQARAGGPTPSLMDILNRSISGPVADLAKNPTESAQQAAQRLEKTLGNIVNITPKENITFQEAHALRRAIDGELYGLRGNKDPWKDAYSDALRQVRGIVSGEIESKLAPGISGSAPWKAANRDYQVASKALEFADKGIDRGVGNNLVSPMEMIAGLTGAGIGSGHGGAGLTLGGVAAGGATALARRYGSGTLGAGALKASNALRSAEGVPPPSAPAAVDPLIVELADYLRRKQLGPVSAAANEEGDR